MSGTQPTNQQPMKADMAIEQLSSSLKSLNCCETARSSSSYRDALDKLHATVMHISPPRQNAVLQSCRSQSEMWVHTQTVPGYIGGNMLLQKSLLPLKLTSRVHMRGALPMRADAMPKRSVQSQALLSIDASDEASELWTMQDHFLKKSFLKPIGF